LLENLEGVIVRGQGQKPGREACVWTHEGGLGVCRKEHPHQGKYSTSRWMGRLSQQKCRSAHHHTVYIMG